MWLEQRRVLSGTFKKKKKKTKQIFDISLLRFLVAVITKTKTLTCCINYWKVTSMCTN